MTIIKRSGMYILGSCLLLGLSALTFAQSANHLNISSPNFGAGAVIPPQYTCQGQNVNPTLEIDTPPKGTASLAIIMEDPDAPGGNFTHWIMWNIPSNTTEIGASNWPNGAILGTNDFGQTNYGGPCPPSGTQHRYAFYVYALNTYLNLPVGAKRAEFLSALRGHVIQSALIWGTASKI